MENSIPDNYKHAAPLLALVVEIQQALSPDSDKDSMDHASADLHSSAPD